MINFRFHIVSLTAVLLSLGIGLVLGTTFLDTATVDVLEGQLRDLEDRLDAAQQENDRLEDAVGSYEQEQTAFREQIGERLLRGTLADVPVLVLSTSGVDEAQVSRVRATLGAADAELLGTWQLTDRLRLDDGDEVGDLGEALELSTEDVERLRSNLANQLGDALFAASDEPAGDVPTDAQGVTGQPAQGERTEPPLVARLREAGFVEYETPEGAQDDRVRLPVSGMRLVIVSDPDAEVPPSEAVVPVLVDFASGGAVPAVAVEPRLVERDGEDDEAPAESLVVDVREDEDLVERVSTVDAIDRASGLAALTLAVADLDPGAPMIGHYGLGEGARLLPPPPEGEG